MKRFWQHAAVAPAEGGYVVRLDARTVRTPRRHELRLPTPGLAQLVAAEWEAQAETVEPDTMPVNRIATSVVDLMPERRTGAIDQLGDYARTDLLCYRAGGPAELVGAYARHWDPALAWLERAHGARLRVVEGLMPADQPPAAVATLTGLIDAFDDWRLVGLHAAATTSGSLVLGLMVAAGALSGEAAADAALVDERFERARWGEEVEALRRERRLIRDLVAADRYLRALG